jgi:hypothetical protein
MCTKAWLQLPPAMPTIGEMLQNMLGYEMNSPQVEKIVRRAVEFDIPMQVHISTSNRG